MNAIAKRELAVPPAVSMLHVAQEVEGRNLGSLVQNVTSNFVISWNLLYFVTVFVKLEQSFELFSRDRHTSYSECSRMSL